MISPTSFHALQIAACGWRVRVRGGVAVVPSLVAGMPYASLAIASGKRVNRLFTLEP
jgi:hypothetical protein